VIGLFLGESPRLLDAVHVAVDCRDTAALGRAAHALKGTVASLAATESSETSARLEALARSGNLSGVEAIWAELDRHVARLRDELTRLGQEAAA
jgi:HPt (histidine-containing phosphotransfer) domain-containing protein